GVLSVYLVALSQRSRPNSYLLLSGFSSALGLLFHYDSLSYIIPIALYLFVRNRKQSYIYLLGLLPILVFYIPYIFSPNFGNTYEYIFGDRISGVFHFDSVHYGVKLLRIYHPDEYLILLAVGLILYFWNISKTSSKYILTIMI